MVALILRIIKVNLQLDRYVRRAEHLAQAGRIGDGVHQDEVDGVRRERPPRGELSHRRHQLHQRGRLVQATAAYNRVLAPRWSGTAITPAAPLFS